MNAENDGAGDKHTHNEIGRLMDVTRHTVMVSHLAHVWTLKERAREGEYRASHIHTRETSFTVLIAGW